MREKKPISHLIIAALLEITLRMLAFTLVATALRSIVFGQFAVCITERMLFLDDWLESSISEYIGVRVLGAPLRATADTIVEIVLERCFGV